MIKTFDLAIKYVKDLDFKSVDIFTYDGLEKINDKVSEQLKRFLKDPDNNIGNEHSKSCTFEVAMYHLMDKAHDRVSCFDVACAIVDENRSVVDNSGGEWQGYPKLMKQLWDKYVNEMEKKPKYLAGEMEGEVFMCAYHYTVDLKS
jgi:hypothetical protein